ncbi:MAG TPA: hypothetical protein PKM63_18790 [Panacibacter sp.]|nr:hypothetical protein [Panacibacter sp.]HNP46349.1 hypothetical protein [Panacibacter sp.]
MKKMIAAVLLLATITVNAQSDKFAAGMKKNLEQMGAAKTTADFQAAAAAFERIGDAEKTQWLPYYYAAMCLTIPAWADGNVDKDANADKIKGFCAKAEAAATTNEDKAEIEAVKNMAATQQMMVDPQSRWMSYGKEAGDALTKGMQLDPNNPRVYYLQGMSLFNTPEQFGGGKDKAKPLFEKAVELYKAAKPKPFYPDWGQKETEQKLAECNQ